MAPEREKNKTNFKANGTMAGLVNNKDWSSTPLGPIESWSQSLKTTVSLCLSSNFPISIAWGAHRVQLYNDGYWPLCGDKHPTSLGQDYKECWASAWPVLGKAFEEASRGTAQFLENQRMFLDRYGYLEETFFTFSFSPIHNDLGEVEGLFHPVTELTQQTLAERRLSLLRRLADLTADAQTTGEAAEISMEAIKEFDLDLPFVLQYKLDDGYSSARLMGSTLEGPHPLRPEKITFPSHSSGEWPLEQAMTNAGGITVSNLNAVFGDFSCGPYEEAPSKALIFPVFIPGETVPHSFLVCGVSARRELDDKYIEFYDLLKSTFSNALTKARALETEKKRAEKLAELDKAKTAFFSNISHEFRTPLTLILGPLEDLLFDGSTLSESQRARIELAYNNSLRLQRLVNSLLDFSRIEAGRLEAVFEPTAITSLTSELANMFSSAMEKAGLDFRIDIKPIGGDVFIDHQMWEKIVFNLLSNALKFTLSGGVSLLLLQEGENIRLTVSDTGEGVAEEERHKLFDRFYRSPNQKGRTHEGSGIGLALVKELVEMHGGSITVNSGLGSGTSFAVTIPTGFGHLPPEQVAPAGSPLKMKQQVADTFINESHSWLRTEARPAEKTNEADRRILIVDDNADMRDYMERIVSGVSGWQAIKAADGIDALEIIRNFRPDIILSDVMMPRMDGFELIKVLKQDPGTASIPLILLSARAGEESTISGLETGADDYMVKPFSTRELIARIRTQLMITQTRQDNTRLKESEERATMAAESADLGTFDIDLLSGTVVASARMAEIFKVDANAGWGTYVNALVEEDIPLRDAAYLKAKKTGILRYNTRINTSRKRLTWISIQGKIYFDKGHKPLRMFGIIREITREKELEQEKDGFISMVSHELRTPITSLKGYTQVLRSKFTNGADPNASRMLDRMGSQIERLNYIVKDLLDVTRLEEGAVNFREALFDLNDLIAEMIEEVLAIQDSHPIEFTAKEPVPIVADRERTSQVLINLLSNAIAYSPRGSAITISAYAEGDKAICVVTDKGKGIENDRQKHIFERFYRATVDRQFNAGLGLGLFISSQIIVKQKGRIWVESEPGKGASFYFSLPLSKERKPNDEQDLIANKDAQ